MSPARSRRTGKGNEVNGADGNSRFRIRPYEPRDRPAVRDICAACAWMGRPDPSHTPDPWIWSEFWTRYFTDREPRHTWMVDAPEGQLGYLTGTLDATCVDRYLPWLVPGIVWRAARRRLLRRPTSRALIRGMLASVARGEMSPPDGVREACPATFHVNLLPEARGGGLGRRLIEAFLERMRKLGVRGVHVQNLSINAAARRCIRRVGFRLAASRRLTAYARVDPQTIDVQTWTLLL